MKLELNTFRNRRVVYGIDVTEDINLNVLAEKGLISKHSLNREDIILNDINNWLQNNGINLLEFVDSCEDPDDIHLHLIAICPNNKLDTEMISQYDQQFRETIDLIDGNRFGATIYPILT